MPDRKDDSFGDAPTQMGDFVLGVVIGVAFTLMIWVGVVNWLR